MAATDAQPVVPEVEHAHFLAFSDYEGVRSAAFTPDGKSILVHMHEPIVDVWALLVYHWPEILSVLTALLTLLFIVQIARVASRRQTRGSPYCRRCNYDLTSQVKVRPKGRGLSLNFDPDARCSECGSDLARHQPRIGRSAARRLLPITVAWIIVVPTYATVMGLKVPRQNAAGEWFRWPSTALAHLADKHDLKWLKRRISIGERVKMIGLATGDVTHDLLWLLAPSYNSIGVSPDGGSFFLSGPKSNEITQYHIRTGARIASVTMPGEVRIAFRDDTIIGFSQDGSVAYVQWLDKVNGVCGVSAWNLENHSQQTLVTEPAYFIDQLKRVEMGRQFRLRDSHHPPQFISCPDINEARGTKTFIVHVHDTESGDVRIIDVQPRPDTFRSGLVMDTRGDRLFAGTVDRKDLMTIDLTQSSPSEPFLLDGHRVGPELAVNGELIAARFAPSGQLILLGHLPTSRLIAKLNFPKVTPIAPAEIEFSPDGRWVAAVTFRGRTTTQSLRELILWNLEPVLKTVPDSSESGQPE